MAMRMFSTSLRAGAAMLLTAALFMTSGSHASAAPAKTYRQVEHNVTLPTQFFPDDICGLRASFETATYKTMITKITEDANGGFHVVDFETGSIAVDYVDPALKDTTFRVTNTFHFNLTPGGTETVTETLRQSDGELFIRYQYHLTVVRGEPKVEREVQLARGCP